MDKVLQEYTIVKAARFVQGQIASASSKRGIELYELPTSEFLRAWSALISEYRTLAMDFSEGSQFHPMHLRTVTLYSDCSFK